MSGKKTQGGRFKPGDLVRTHYGTRDDVEVEVVRVRNGMAEVAIDLDIGRPVPALLPVSDLRPA